MKPNSNNSATLKEWTAIVLLTFGIILAFVALLMPPPGEIHDSVLYIFAQILIYAGSIFGIGSYINHKIKNGPTPLSSKRRLPEQEPPSHRHGSEQVPEGE